MITKITVAILVTVLGTYGGTQLLTDIQPVVENTTADATIRSVLEMALIQEGLNVATRDEALTLAIQMTPDAEGMYLENGYVVYNVLDTCLRGSFGEYDKKVIEPC
jgi:hypothetical protein